MTPSSSHGRRSRAALREMLLEAGIELLIEEGLGLGAEQITYKRVFDRIQETTGITITRGSVHDRIWSNQREFQIDLLRRAATYDPTPLSHAVAETTLNLLGEIDANGNDDIPRLVQEACRQGARSAIDHNMHWAPWDMWLSVWAMFTLNLDRQPAETASIAAEVRESIHRVDRDLGDTLEDFASALGLEPRAATVGDRSLHETIELLARFANSIGEGSALRRRLDAEPIDQVELPTGPGGELQTWTLQGLGIWLMVQFCLELGP